MPALPGLLLSLSLALGLVSMATTAVGAAQPPKPDIFDPEAAIAHSQSAIGRRLSDLGFIDERGRAARLSDAGGRPLVVSLVFTACAESCPILIEHLAEAVEAAQDALGADSFSVITVGFDPEQDSPQRMRAYARSHGIDLPNWRFLSGAPETIDTLIEELGYLRLSSPRGFDHVAQTSIVDSERRIFAHVYGDSFPVPALVEPLKALLFERASPLTDLAQLVERVRLFCTFYDPGKGRYAFDYSFFIALTVGALTLLGLGVILTRAWLRAAKPPRAKSRPGSLA